MEMDVADQPQEQEAKEENENNSCEKSKFLVAGDLVKYKYLSLLVVFGTHFVSYLHKAMSQLKETNKDSEPQIPRWRYVIVVLATSVAAVGLSCSFAFNFAIVCKVNATVDTYELYQRDPSNSPVMHFSTFESSLLYSAYPLGNFCMLVVMVLTGGFTHVRWTIFVAILVSSLTTILVPPLYDWNIHTTLILKILQGASVAPTVPLVGHVTAYWTPKAEIGLFVSLLTSYSQIGLFYLMATSGITCEYFAWRGIFYLNGFTSLLFGILWIFLFRDHPSDLKRTKRTSEECSKVIARPKHEPVPYKEFFTSLPIWSCLIAAFGNFGGISPFMTFAPAILKKAVNLSDIAASYYNTSSFILQLFLKIFSGKMSDLWTSMNETNKVRLFNTLSMGVAGALCVLTAFIPVEHQVICAVLICLLQGTIGFNSAGYNKAAVIVARQHAHLLLTCFGLIVTFVTLIQPFIVQLVAPDHTWDQWYYLFIGNGLVLVLSNLIFCVTIEAKPAAFTEKSAVANGNSA